MIDNLLEDLLKNIRMETQTPKFIYNDFENFDKEKTNVFYSGPFWDDEEIIRALKAFLTGKWLSSGEFVHKFEKRFVKKFNSKSGIMVNSGSSANLVMIGGLKKVFGWQDNDEIIVSPVGFPTTIAPIVQHGLKPVFVDIEFDTLNFDVKKIKPMINSRTKAIFLSPVLGNPPDMDIILQICDDHKLELILDGCDSLGTSGETSLFLIIHVRGLIHFIPRIT